MNEYNSNEEKGLVPAGEEIKEERMDRAMIFWSKENNKYILNND